MVGEGLPHFARLFFGLPLECVKLRQNRAKTLVFAYIIEGLPFKHRKHKLFAELYAFSSFRSCKKDVFL